MHADLPEAALALPALALPALALPALALPALASPGARAYGRTMLDRATRGPVLGRTGLEVSPIGLGCSRLGSTLAGLTREAAIGLVHHALDRGVTLFDTADIYGQGDSERLLGAALGSRRANVVIVSKAGQRFTGPQRVAALFKKPIRAAAARVPMLRAAVAGQRAGKLPRDISPEHIERALMGSLKRLGTDWLDLFLLHSPDAAELRQGRCFERLDRLREQGVIRHWGVSCDDRPTAEAALAIPGVSVLQLPLADLVGLEGAPDLVARAAADQVALLVREIYANPPDPPGAGWRAQRVAAALALPNAAALVGTTRPEHLDQALAALPSP